MVVCFITEPMNHSAYNVFTKSMLIFSVLIVACYILCIFVFRKIHMSSNDAKSIYRSLVVISLTVVFGWLSTAVIATVVENFHLNIVAVNVNLLAGLFINFSMATNFFIFYAMRQVKLNITSNENRHLKYDSLIR
ncbi:hypothetical protein DICVIV_10008 [Dictyocaulus viviparus]|uniref:G-protein coupled receptors family 1 profile domain-containing protein n=1 Tax=Dictyocaulus viviparus TaxID=29172 RepID=A0A0D8XJF4_DICVI|nr:hypothetical protein DICVIV_10008 [Dictyocaulus viviparus]